MSDPVSIMAIGSLIGGGLSMFGSKKEKTLEPPTPPTMPNLPQAPTPEQADFRKQSASDAERKRNKLRQGRASMVKSGSALGDLSIAPIRNNKLLGS